jgi:hypothetical protein
MSNSRYRPAAGIAWAIVPEGVSIHDLATGRIEQIALPESVAWDLIARGIELPDAMQIYRFVAGESPDPAADDLSKWVQQWIQRRWIEPAGGDGHG